MNNPEVTVVNQSTSAWSPVLRYRRHLDSGLPQVTTAALLFACKGVFIKMAYSHGASVADMMMLRMIFSIPVYLLVMVLHWKKELAAADARHRLPAVLLTGICGYYIASYLDMLGLQTVSAALERILVYVYPVFVVLLTALVMRRRLSLAMIGYIVLSYAGLLMVFFADLRGMPSTALPDITRGSLLVLGSAFCFAVYVVSSDVLMRFYSSHFYTAVAMLAACAAMTVHYLLREDMRQLLALSWSVIALGALTALAFTVLPSFLLSSGIRKVGSSRAGAVGMVGPIATVLVAAAVLGEPVSALQIAGFIVVIAGIRQLGRLRTT